MPVPVTAEQLVELIRKSALVEPERLDPYLKSIPSAPATAVDLAAKMIADGVLTNFQKEQLLQGKWRGYTIGKYRVLERLGTGGMGSVYLCEHQKMKHKVAVKVLPTAKASDPAALGRFYREARAAGVLDHPNLVRAHDIDQDGGLHYLIMDYIDGVNLQHLVSRSTGPLPYVRAAHYIYQAAHGLQHAYEKGLVHRDIKPANLLLDRSGTLKILDMGLARFLDDNKDLLTLKYDDNNVLGTADYVSPEQAMDSHEVDIRTDIYSLGATFYFLLTGRPLFTEGKVAQKLIWHQTREPAPIRQFRPDIPPELEVIVERMLAKDRDARFQTPEELIDALESWVQTPIEPPSEAELPQLSPAARSPGSEGGSSVKTPPRYVMGTATNRHITGQRSQYPTATAVVAPITNDRTADHATPRILASSEETTPVAERAQRAAPQAPPAPPVTTQSSRRKLVILLLTLTLGAGAGVGLRWAVRSATAPKDAGEGRILIVDRTKSQGTFCTIIEALKVSRPGDTIQVRDAVWDEVLRLESGGDMGRGVTIQGMTDDGNPVIWQTPAGRRDLPSLIHLSAVQGLRLRNFTLDGKNSTQNLITVSGPCPGLILEDLKLVGFRMSGIRLTSGSGDEASPLLFHRVLAAPETEAESAAHLDAYPDQPCHHVKFSECRFEGRAHAGVVLAGPVANLELSRCRFSGLISGLIYRKGTTPAALGLKLVDNEFQDLRHAGLHFEATPPVEGSVIQLTGNRFTRVRMLAHTDNFRSEPIKTTSAWIWLEPGTATDGDKVYLRRRFTLEAAPTRGILSVVADASCVVWLNGHRVGQLGLTDGSRRVQAFDVARHLQQGENVLAIEATGGKRAGVLAELNDNATGVFTRSFASDAMWKTSRRGSTGWQSPVFDDTDWKPARVVAPYGQGDASWQNLVWDAVVQEQFKYQAGQVFPTPSGNQRDAPSAEGFPSFDAVVGAARK